MCKLTPNFWYQWKPYEQPGLHNTIISLHVRMTFKRPGRKAGVSPQHNIKGVTKGHTDSNNEVSLLFPGKLISIAVLEIWQSHLHSELVKRTSSIPKCQ